MTEEKIGCGIRFDNGSAERSPCNQFNLCPSCQKKKDNHSQQYHIAEPIVSDERSLTEKSQETRYRADEEPDKNSALVKIDNSSGSDIQQSKIFEDVIKLIDETEKLFMPITDVNANSFMDLREQIFNKLKSKIKEKWGKIE
jgi:hypothetical protein